MCIIFVKRKGKIITDKKLENAFLENRDGIGFMFATNNILRIRKGYKSFDDFLKDFRESERLFDVNFVIHFRTATSGLLNLENTQPVPITDNLAIAHNGILSGYGNKHLSDTVEFAKYLKYFQKDFLKTTWKRFIENIAVESGSKFVFLDNQGRYTILNEGAGKWFNGVWQSFKEDKLSIPNFRNYYSYFEYEQCDFCLQMKEETGYYPSQNMYMCDDCARLLNCYEERQDILGDYY